ncbi:MAG: hypothetical protein HOE19_04145 [Candidatus Komeilibacteria bacterium]|jgi:hypothetical protein|nr:hypothetical protein [Candidatus Komeilibacteria bacterium]MBT4447865.1 hypothetical protein [Candidatus Komeilibacteria bacterium]
MGKLTKKLIIYLDQNFISEIAKVDINSKVNLDYKKLFDLIHRGFLEEKIIVPKSFFHKIESSLAGKLTDRIGQFQSYMGQISLHHEDTLETSEIVRNGEIFLGIKRKSIEWSFVYTDNPDKILEQFDIDIRSSSYLQLLTDGREQEAQKLQQVQKNLKEKNISFEKQTELEIGAIRDRFKQYNIDKINWLFKGDAESINKFIDSEDFIIPQYYIYARMWAYLLTVHNNRPIKVSDGTDIDIISSYLPYVDVLATDSFMGRTIKELKLDTKYKTKIFFAKEESRKELIKFLEDYLTNNEPVNVPDVSIFVLSDDGIKKDSFDFFKKLGLMGINKRRGWIELFAFDDGKMPEYYDERINNTWPFYGLQHFKVIKINKENNNIIDICKSHCRSKKFVLINSYRKIPPNFKDTLFEYCGSDKYKILGYNIYDVS